MVHIEHSHGTSQAKGMQIKGIYLQAAFLSSEMQFLEITTKDLKEIEQMYANCTSKATILDKFCDIAQHFSKSWLQTGRNHGP